MACLDQSAHRSHHLGVFCGLESRQRSPLLLAYQRASQLGWLLLPLTMGACGTAARGPSSAGEGGTPTVAEQELILLAELSPERLPAPPPDVSNRFADDAIAAELGRTWFFEPRFAGRLLDPDNDGSGAALGRKGDVQKVSCAGCHLPESAFSDTRTVRRQISLGAGWGRRKAPSLLDVGQSKLLMWDGRSDTLYNQIMRVIESPVEMNSSRLFVAQQVFALYREPYERLFGVLPPLDDAQRFPPLDATETGCAALDSKNACTTAMRGSPGDGAEFDGMAAEDQDAVTRVVVNVGKAMGAYQRLLSCGPSRFDHFMRGDRGALSVAEQRGAALFVGKGKCVSCHSGPFLSDEKFHNVGMRAEVVATAFLNA